jgi:HSP20 family protein
MARDTIRIVSLFFPGPAASGTAWQPAADVYRTPTGWLVKFELAGVRPGDVQLRVLGRRLTVSGARRDCCLHAGCRHHQLEIDYGRFERAVELPEPIDAARFSAEHEHGMLLVRIDLEARP